MPVRIVTDSTSSIPIDVATELGVSVIPLHVHFGTTGYREGVDLSTTEFYELLGTSSDHPATSQPNPAEFLELYRQIDGVEDIVSIHLSTDLSKTIESARQAAAQISQRKIHVLDSRLVSVPLAFTVIAAANAARAGANAQEISQLVDDRAHRSHVAIVVPTLEYLKRGGRIGGASAYLGSLLNFKPVLEARGGRVEPVTRVRSFGKAHAALKEYVDTHAPNGVETWAILHANAPEHRDRIRQEITQNFDKDIQAFDDIAIGPVLGTHAGPGAFGIAFVARP